jgi:hypothetical protein
LSSDKYNPSAYTVTQDDIISDKEANGYFSCLFKPGNSQGIWSAYLKWIGIALSHFCENDSLKGLEAALKAGKSFF